jgi:hypothetical protein
MIDTQSNDVLTGGLRMHSEIVERVAKVLYEERMRLWRETDAHAKLMGTAIHWDGENEAYRDQMRLEARLAIEAMRPYNLTMIKAGYKALMDWDARTGDDAGIHEVWEAMIDAALTPAAGGDKSQGE